MRQRAGRLQKEASLTKKMLDAFTDGMALLQLARLVITFYLTIALMGIGFAIMCGGPDAAGAAARWFFLAPLQALLGRLRSAGALMLGSVWTGAVWARKRIAQATRRELKELAADVRWVVSRFDR